MTNKLLPFFLACFIIGDNDANYVAQCINAGIIN